jgi:ketosteroid isomerase-like protein
MTDFQSNKALVRDFYQALSVATVDTVEGILSQYMSPDVEWFGVYPFDKQQGPKAIAEAFWKPFLSSFANVQRREDVFMAGSSEIDGDEWVTSMGHFMGLFDQPWLGIPGNRKMAFLRYADFNCVKDGKIVRAGFFCDIISVMHQVGIQPLPLQTGASFIYPGPQTHDGLQLQPHPPQEAEKTLELLNGMIADLSALNLSGNDRCPPEVLARSWHQNMIWYGPAGIGATYTIERYQEQHQYPFREGLKGKTFNGHVCRYAEGNYACFFGWPNLSNTATGGFMGLPGGEVPADMRVVDVYRREGDKLMENWVLIDIPWWLKQQGLDILERTRSIVAGP